MAGKSTIPFVRYSDNPVAHFSEKNFNIDGEYNQYGWYGMRIIGHRGGPAMAPENTIRSIRAAMECADDIEVDVRLSHEGIPVIIHDARLDRTTSGTGQVNDHTFPELRSFDAGDGENIPSLKEVCTLVLGTSTGLFIEIKEPGSEEAVCNVLAGFPIDHIVIVSFHEESLSLVREYIPGIKTGIVLPNAKGHEYRVREDSRTDFLLSRSNFLTFEVVQYAHAHGVQVIAWTLNSQKQQERGVLMGIDGFVTDDPCRAFNHWHRGPEGIM